MEEYRGKEIIVRWDTMTCAHSGRCVKALPSVFNVKKKPWVQTDAASADDIRQAVSQCPSGALTYENIAPPCNE